jgi:organic hydroperoxide reductase OsmC/OhrA
MKISATIRNGLGRNDVDVQTDGRPRALDLPSKTSGRGSAVNGGELLFVALATCFCNDLYREAAQRGIEITAVDVTVRGEFGAAGEPARDIEYRAAVRSPASADDIRQLIAHTDTVAEIHNTVRHGTDVSLVLDESAWE